MEPSPENLRDAALRVETKDIALADLLRGAADRIEPMIESLPANWSIIATARSMEAMLTECWQKCPWCEWPHDPDDTSYEPMYADKWHDPDGCELKYLLAWVLVDTPAHIQRCIDPEDHPYDGDGTSGCGKCGAPMNAHIPEGLDPSVRGYLESTRSPGRNGISCDICGEGDHNANYHRKYKVVPPTLPIPSGAGTAPAALVAAIEGETCPECEAQVLWMQEHPQYDPMPHPHHDAVYGHRPSRAIEGET